VTLVPPLEVAQDRLPDVERHLGEVAGAAAAYRIHLRGSGTFRPVSPVVFVNLVEGISQTEQLASDCRRGPLALDLEYPYHPHVTVAHHLDDVRLDRAFEELESFDCAFSVAEFHLYVHDADHGWKATSDFTLTGPDT
jgi:2'-5' RNA ligase